MNRTSSFRSDGWTWFLASQLLIGPVCAWEDTPLTWEAGGEISGLPEGFGRASLHIRFLAGERAGIAGVELELAAKRMTLPECLLKHLGSRRKEDVLVSGSWHPGMQPHLALLFALPREGAESTPEGVYVSFGLRDAELGNVYTVTGGGGKEVELSASCRADVKDRTMGSNP